MVCFDHEARKWLKQQPFFDVACVLWAWITECHMQVNQREARPCRREPGSVHRELHMQYCQANLMDPSSTEKSPI